MRARLDCYLLFLLGINLLAACGGSGSKPNSFAPEANLPLYFTVAGAGPGQGAVYKIARLARGSTVEPELVVGGLDFPSGMTVDRTGALYIAEKMPAPYGTIKKLARGSSELTTAVTGLDNPVGVAVDSFNHLYISESDRNLISRSDAKGVMQTFKSDEISLPRDITVDFNDRVFLTELDGGIVSELTRDGLRHVLASGLSNPFGLALSGVNELHVIVNGGGLSDNGSIVKLSNGQSETIVDGLLNPIAMTYNSAHGFFIIEGSPANRIVNYSLKTRRKSVVAATGVNPYSIAMSSGTLD